MIHFGIIYPFKCKLLLGQGSCLPCLPVYLQCVAFCLVTRKNTISLMTKIYDQVMPIAHTHSHTQNADSLEKGSLSQEIK